MSIEEDKIEALTQEVTQIREELALMPDRIIERIRQEFKTISNPHPIPPPPLPPEAFTNRPLVTIREASAITGLTERGLQLLAKTRKLPGFHHGRMWFLDKSAVESYKSPKSGRPKKASI